MYTELNITFLGLKMPNFDMLIIDDPPQVLDKKHQSKLAGIVGWNLVQLSYNDFVKKYGTSTFNSFIWRELILCFSPNSVSTTTQTQVVY